MISICIPVYNFEVNTLVKSLLEQIEHTQDEFEIVVADDASDSFFKEKNEFLKRIESIKYLEKESNTGRSSIRNYLADHASGDYLLFIDADSEIPSTSFLKDYTVAVKNNRVVCGGTQYGSKPEEKDLMLRYVFGVNREVRTLEEREANPHRSFSAHNFCIEKKLFQEHRFDEKIKSYGHEDTLLGINLQKENVEICHIDNPLIHIGLEPAEEFLSKTNTGLENLILLLKRHPEWNEIADEVKVLRYYFSIKKMGLSGIVSSLFKLRKKSLLKNLQSENPNLYYFDFYKLGYLCKRAKELKL